jgi:threonine aldolase
MTRMTVDLRSDTVTLPTSEMRRAMAEAELGDDVLGDDPTVQRLERKSAEMLGKDAGLFVPSGTMGNNIAINVHTRHGDEVLLDWESHSLCYEVGAAAVISGVQTRQYRSNRGVPDVNEILRSVTRANLHAPGTTLVIVENTHNRQGGAIVPLAVMEELYSSLRERGVALHLDGARIFNAAVATGVPAAAYAAQADSVTFCLSKGLCCPIGSVLCGTRDFVERARRARKMFGGGMRQVGILAACGIVALDTMIDRLAEDHVLAKRLADGLVGAPGISVDPSRTQTNMVYFDTDRPAQEVVDLVGEQGVLCYAFGPNTIRMVTHRDVDPAGIDYTVRICRSLA